MKQYDPGAARRAGRPGKHVQGPVTPQTVFRDGKPDRLFTLEEVFGILRVSRSTWDKWRRCGLTPPVMALPNGSIRVWESDLVRWSRAQEAN